MTDLRRATAQDAPAIADVHVRAWKAAYPGLLPQDYLDALRAEDRIGMWEETLAGAPWPAVLVAGEAGSLAGFCSFGPTRDDDADPAVTGELYTIYVDPTAWRTGTGRGLLEAATTGLAGAGFSEATLWTLGVNDGARAFYERFGWRPDGATKRHDWGAFVATDARYRRPLR